MRTNAPLLVVAAAALIGLSGCSAPSSEEPAAEAPESSTETAPAPTSGEELAEDVASTTPPEACVSYEGTPPAPPAGAEGLVDAASAASLPDGVSLSLGVQIIASSDPVGSFEAVARICSEPLPEDEFRSAATSIAVAMKEDAASESLRVLKVTSWSPDAAGDLQQGATLTADYPSYTWDPETSGVPLDANWDWS